MKRVSYMIGTLIGIALSILAIAYVICLIILGLIVLTSPFIIVWLLIRFMFG